MGSGSRAGEDGFGQLGLAWRFRFLSHRPRCRSWRRFFGRLDSRTQDMGDTKAFQGALGFGQGVFIEIQSQILQAISVLSALAATLPVGRVDP